MIRIATDNDAEKILDIYIPFIVSTGITQDTDVPTVHDFKVRIRKVLETYPWLVCDINGVVAGYAYASKHRERKGYDWCIESSVYIDYRFNNKSIAKALYHALFALLKIQGFVNAYAVITLPNDQSVAFHEKSGFHYLTTFKKIGYKLGKWHDVGWWEKKINPHDKIQRDPIKLPDLDTVLVSEILDKASKLVKI